MYNNNFDHFQVRKSYPYLTTARFPHNWAIAEMVKGYIAGTRKEHNRLAREAGDEGEQSGGGDSEKENNPSNDNHPPPLKKKNRSVFELKVHYIIRRLLC